MGQRGISTGLTGVGAAKYVGRVGALALALGVGAAVVGGAGLANAEGTPDGSPSDGSSSVGSGASTAPDPTPAAGAVSDTDAPASDSTGGKKHEPSPLDVPKMVFDGGVPAERHDATAADQDSLGGLPSSVPTKIAAALPTGMHDAPRANPRVSSRTNDDPRPTQPTVTEDDPVTSFVRAKTDDLAATFRKAVPLVDTQSSSTPEVNSQQRLTVSPSIAAVPAVVSPAAAAPRVANPVATVLSSVLSALGFSPSENPDGSPLTPVQIVVGALQLIHREIEHFVANVTAAQAFYASSQTPVPPAVSPGVPSPGDEASTVYGDIGKWMLESDGQISNYGGQPYGGKTVLEAVNVIIVDPTSTSPGQAAAKLNAAMFRSGFPAQPIHSGGFEGEIDDVVYGQQPTGLLEGFSDNLFVLPNDHGRIFGPAPVQTSAGYVWSGAFSTEALDIYNFLPAHAYVSSDMARTELAYQMIFSGQATYLGMVPLDNAYDSATTTTGDHDGYAVVLQLN